MRSRPSVSIVLSTYDRADQIGPAIEHLLAQTPNAPPYEVIVVDNNSTDGTRRIIEAFVTRSDGRLRYVFEPRQGLSNARNAGVAEASAEILAFTDDDVRVSPGWVAAIERAFAAHPRIDCLGGRILPIWPGPTPQWLTRRHWVGPLALQDYGEEPFEVNACRPLSLAGANFAFRKGVFDRIGLFSPDFPRSEDTELLIRLWLAGGRGLYVPDMLIHAAVQPARLTKAYYREWFTNMGRCNARMRFEELSDPLMGLRDIAPDVSRIFGAPRFAIRELAGEIWGWLTATIAEPPDTAFAHETRIRLLGAYIRESRAIQRQAARSRCTPRYEDDCAPVAHAEPTRNEW
jgi:glycosyltransferase involved in cell wall biosynthesis